MRARGFTLAELMIVVVLFGVVAVLAAINLSNVRKASDIDAFARALMNHVTTARRRAVQTGRPYVLDLRPNSVSFCQQDPTNSGQRTCPSPAGLESSRRFDAGSDATVVYYATDLDNPTLGSRPTRNAIGTGTALLLLPNGSCDSLPQTPVPDGFSIYLRSASNAARRRLVGISPTAARPRITDNW